MSPWLPRPTWLLPLFVILLSGSLLQAEPAGDDDAPRRPNFVFLFVDDLGYMDIGANNPDCFYDTPHIDRLAQSGMRFTDGYAANPVCSPTRFSIMTGRYPTRARATNWFSGVRSGRFDPAPLNDRMELSEFTLAEALREGGYRTAFLGKWHLGATEDLWPEHQGFEVNHGGFNRGSPPSYFSPYNNPRLSDGPEGEYLPARLAEEAAGLIDQYGDEPFLIYLSFYSVHTPLRSREDLITKYQEKAAQLPEVEEFANEEQVWPVDAPRQVRVAQRHPTYAAMVESMDQAVGRVLDQLEASGVADNTVVFFFSDNGGLSTSEGSPTSNLPLRGGKGWVYEGGIREPLLIRWPGTTAAGSVCSHPVTSTDFYPTMLEIASLEPRPEQHEDGVSLVPLLKDPAAALDRDAIYWHYPHYSNQGGFPGGAVRVGDWKLVERYEDGRVHLYNLAEDLGERDDRARDEPQRTAAMREKLHRWYKEVDAQFLSAREGGPQPWRP